MPRKNQSPQFVAAGAAKPSMRPRPDAAEKREAAITRETVAIALQ